MLYKLKHRNKEMQPLPSWKRIVETMYDKYLSFIDDVVKVIYSKDKTKRFVVLKSSKGFYKYVYEEIRPFDEEE